METEEARQTLGQRIRKLRKEQNLSVRKFALMIGLSKDYIVDIEYARKSPSLDTILKISSGLGVAPSDLLEGIGTPEDYQRDATDQDTRPNAQGGSPRYQSSRL